MASFKGIENMGGTPGMKLRELMERIKEERDPDKKKALQNEARTIREGMGGVGKK